METLTKENFWNEMEQKYPKAMAHFKAWIDNYNTEPLVYWDPKNDYVSVGNGSGYYRYTYDYCALPIAMQFGIFLQFSYYIVKPPMVAFLMNSTFHTDMVLFMENYMHDIDGWLSRMINDGSYEVWRTKL